MPFCISCGHQNEGTARFCNGCGQQMPTTPTAAPERPIAPPPSGNVIRQTPIYNQPPYPHQQPYRSHKNKTTATLIAWLFWPALDFYLGNTGKGTGKLLTFGGLGIWALVDAIKLLFISQQEFDARYNNQKVDFPNTSNRPQPQQAPTYREALATNQSPSKPVQPVAATHSAPESSPSNLSPVNPSPVSPARYPASSTTPTSRPHGSGDGFLVTGVNGQIELIGNRIRITRRGFMGFLSQGLKGDKEILISQISSVQIRPPGDYANGYIQFAFIGGQESKAGLFDSATDENSVVFNKEQQEDFDELKRRIDTIMDAMAMPSAPVMVAQSSVDELEKLASLHARGILTDAEFEAKKKGLLGI